MLLISWLPCVNLLLWLQRMQIFFQQFRMLQKWEFKKEIETNADMKLNVGIQDSVNNLEMIF